MFKDITIQNFRGIKDLNIGDFRRINLLVGQNNCGKTSILESLFLLIAPTNAELPLKVNILRTFTGIDENSWLLFFNKLNFDSNIVLSADSGDGSEKRELVIKGNFKHMAHKLNGKSTISKEALHIIKGTSSETAQDLNGLILEYSYIKKGMKKKEKISTQISTTDTGIEFSNAVNYKENLKGIFIKTENTGKDMAIRFNNIQIKKQVGRIVKILRLIEPSLVDLTLGANEILYCDIGLNRLIPINFMGDGIYRLLSIISAILDLNGGIVLIDEIENGLHYTSQKVLWKALFETAKEFDVQIFATTHSIECIKAFSEVYFNEDKDDEIRLYRIERKKDKTTAISYDCNVLKASLDSEWEVR